MAEYFQDFKQLIFCDASKRKVEVAFGVLAIFTFFSNILLIFLARTGLVDLPQFVDASFISTVAAPLTIILLSEIYLLIRSYTKPLLYSLIFQIEVVSLIFIRDVFKVFADLEGLSNGNISVGISEIVFTLVIGALLFVTAITMSKFSDKLTISEDQEPRIVIRTRGMVSLLLLLGGIFALIAYTIQNVAPDPLQYLADGPSLIPFFEMVFTMMILADVLLFLINFLYNDEYSGLFRSVVYLVATILIRISLTADFPVNLVLVIVAIVATIGITALTYRMQKMGLLEKP